MNPEPPGDDRLARFVAYFERLGPAELAHLDDIYARAARFVDPFNDVIGIESIRAIFAQMFEQLESPRFVVRTRIVQSDQAFVSWDFSFRPRRLPGTEPWVIHGASHLRFDPSGRVAEHIDYWDAAGQLYERLPLIGILMRLLRRRLQHR